MEIKEAAEKHIPEITRLWMEFIYFNKKTDPPNMNDTTNLEQVTTHFKEKIRSEDALVLVAIENGNVVGYSVAEITHEAPLSSTGRIYDVAITSQYRNKGIGKNILDGVKAWFASRDISKIELSTITKKYIDDSFWEKQGF